MEPKPTYAELAHRIQELEKGALPNKDGASLPGPPQLTPKSLTALYAISQTVNQSLNLTGKIMRFYVKASSGSKVRRPAG